MEVGFGKRKAEEMMRIARDLSDADVLSSSPEDHLTARRVADDVGCYVQKVAKFGEKLEREKIIGREKVEELNKNIYYGPDAAAEEEGEF